MSTASCSAELVSNGPFPLPVSGGGVPPKMHAFLGPHGGHGSRRRQPIASAAKALAKVTFRNNYRFSDRFVIIAYSVLYFHSNFTISGENPLLPRKVRPKTLHLPGKRPFPADFLYNWSSTSLILPFSNPISHFLSDKTPFSRQVLFQQDYLEPIPPYPEFVRLNNLSKNCIPQNYQSYLCG